MNLLVSFFENIGIGLKAAVLLMSWVPTWRTCVKPLVLRFTRHDVAQIGLSPAAQGKAIF